MRAEVPNLTGSDVSVARQGILNVLQHRAGELKREARLERGRKNSQRWRERHPDAAKKTTHDYYQRRKDSDPGWVEQRREDARAYQKRTWQALKDAVERGDPDAQQRLEDKRRRSRESKRRRRQAQREQQPNSATQSTVVFDASQDR